MPAKQKSLARVVIAITLVLAIGVSMWFAVPTKALQVDITPPPAGELGDIHNFTVTVTIVNPERLPLTHVHMYIYKADNPSYKATLANLPFNTGSKSYSSSDTGDGGAATVVATAGSGLVFNSAGGGYVIWEGAPHTWPGSVNAYAYAFAGSVSVNYNVNWTSPSNWPSGSYKIETKLITVDDTTFTKTSASFSLTQIPGGGIGGGGPLPKTEPTLLVNVMGKRLAYRIDDRGVMLEEARVTTGDGKLTIMIPTGTTAKDEKGKPLSSLEVIVEKSPASPPRDANIIGLTYDFKPDGANFTPPITVTFGYNPADLPAGLDEEDLVIAFWDITILEWVRLGDITVDPVADSISAKVSHFTDFAIIAFVRPATFTAQAIIISPTEANIGEPVTISVIVTNSGDLAGSHKVTFKLDNEVIAIKEITLAGQATGRVAFTTARYTAGSYAISVDGLSGKFVVKPVPVPPTPVAPPPVPAPEPTPAAPLPVPEAIPAPVITPSEPSLTPLAPPINWWLIGSIASGLIVIGTVVSVIVIRHRRSRRERLIE